MAALWNICEQCGAPTEPGTELCIECEEAPCRGERSKSACRAGVERACARHHDGSQNTAIAITLGDTRETQ